MSGHVCASHIAGCVPSALSAWCPVTNLIAIVSSSSSNSSNSSGSSETKLSQAPTVRGGAEKDPNDVQQQHSSIILVEPGCCEEYFTLDLPASAAGSEDAVVSISWTPPGTKRALLVAMRKGPCITWMQEPVDDSQGEPAPLPAINCWYASQLGEADGPAPAPEPPAAPSHLPPPKPVEDEMPDFFTQDTDPPCQPAAPLGAMQPKPLPPDPAPAAQDTLVYAGWLSPPPVMHWSTARLTQEVELQQLFETAFLPEGDVQLPVASWSAVQHWVRPSLLAAAFVKESGQVTFWWAAMSTRSMSRLSWRSSQPVQLLQHGTVTQAHACSSLENAVRFALVTAEEPDAVQLFEISGTQTLANPGSAPPPHRVSTSPLAVLKLPQDAGPAAPLQPFFSVSFLPSSFGRTLVTASILGLPGLGPQQGLHSPAPSPSSSCLLTLFRQSQPHSPWEPAASYEAPGPDGDTDSIGIGLVAGCGLDPPSLGPAAREGAAHAPGAAGCMAVSEDGSKVVLLAGGVLRVLDGTLLQPLASRELTGAGAGPGSQRSGGGGVGGGGGSTLCISPNSCCVAVACAQPRPSGAAPAAAAWAGDAAASPDASVGDGLPPPAGSATAAGMLLEVLILPEVRPAPSPPLPTAFGPPDPAAAAAGKAWQSLSARLNAFRLVHASLTGRQPWDIVQRVLQLVAEAGQSSAAETLDVMDLMFMAFDDFPRPSYSMTLDRVKLAVLRRLPGRAAAVVAADLAARMVLKQRHHVLMVLNSSGGGGGGDGAADRQARQDDLVAVQPWLAWGYEYLMLVLSSVKRFQQQAPAAAPGGVDAAAAAGGAAAEAADLLPGLRLLQDSTAMQKLVSLLVGWVSWARQASKSRAADPRVVGEQEALIRAFLSVCNSKELAQSREPLEQHPGGISRGVFSGPYHLHIARPSRGCATGEKIKAVLQASIMHLVPDLTPDELMTRARELGVASPGAEVQQVERLLMAKAAMCEAWGSWRGAAWEEPGAGAGGAGAQPQEEAVRQRWRRQRARALQPLGSAAASGSRAAAAAAAETFPLLDALSGRRLPWETAAVSYECVDAAFATAELAPGGEDGGGGGDAAEAPAGQGGRAAAGQAMLRKSWLRSFTPAGTMWKRVKVKHLPT